MLAVCDVTHIAWACWDLGRDVALRPTRWSASTVFKYFLADVPADGLAFGNIGITVMLFVGRMLWFATTRNIEGVKKRS